jgi:hypothetical protein
MGEFDILIGDWNVVGSALRDNLIESSKGTETETLSKRAFSPTTVKKRTVMNQQLSKLGREDAAGKTHKDWIVRGAGIVSVGAGVDGVYLLDEKICDCSDPTCTRKDDGKAPAHCNDDARDLPMLPVPGRHFSDHFALIRRFQVKEVQLTVMQLNLMGDSNSLFEFANPTMNNAYENMQEHLTGRKPTYKPGLQLRVQELPQ